MKRVPFLITFLAPVLFLTAGCHHAGNAPVVTGPPQGVAGTSLPPLKSPSGNIYTRTRVGPADDDEPVVIALVPPGGVPSVDTFQGSARAAAKLSIGSGPLRPFSELGAVLDSLIPDATMRAMNIGKGPDSGRLAVEQELVTVNAFLYASSRESDNDYHCIVGLDPSQPARFINVEVSGLPPSTSAYFAVLNTARNEFKAFFTANGNALPVQGYDKYEPPIPIKVAGSLFFDVDHVPPAVGPVGLKPVTAWEIHPVSDIQFEPVT